MNVANNITLIGRLTKDAEFRSAGEAKVASFSLAVNRNRKDLSGQYPTDFINCQAWNSTANYIEQYIKKGNQVAVSGELHVENYTNKEGVTVYKTYVNVDSITNLTPKEASTNNAQALAEANKAIHDKKVLEPEDDDLPF